MRPYLELEYSVTEFCLRISSLSTCASPSVRSLPPTATSKPTPTASSAASNRRNAKTPISSCFPRLPCKATCRSTGSSIAICNAVHSGRSNESSRPQKEPPIQTASPPSSAPCGRRDSPPDVTFTTPPRSFATENYSVTPIKLYCPSTTSSTIRATSNPRQNVTFFQLRITNSALRSAKTSGTTKPSGVSVSTLTIPPTS